MAIPETKNFGEDEMKPVKSLDLWFRQSKKSDIQNHRINTTIRIGNREHGTGDPKGGYAPGDIVVLKIQKEDGSFDEWQTNIAITRIEQTSLARLTDDDFASSLENKKELEAYYGNLSEDQEVTLIGFEYLDEVDSAKDLVRVGVLKRAELPAANPADFGDGSYTVPLIEDDYPAMTPVMWNAAYEKFGMHARNFMLVGNASHTREILSVFRRDKDYMGGGAGVGFKDESFQHMDELDPLAEAIGSINFIRKTSDGKLKGYNTDGRGYVASLEQMFAEKDQVLAGKKVLVLGGGGTANSVVFALVEKGCNTIILNRSVSKALKELAQRVNSFYKTNLASVAGEDAIADFAPTADAIVNVSKKGAKGELEQYSALAPATVPNLDQNLAMSAKVLASLKKDVVASDVNLVGHPTPFLKAASEAGISTLDGIPMVVNQGVEAFWILYGEELSAKGVAKEDVAKVMTEAARRK